MSYSTKKKFFLKDLKYDNYLLNLFLTRILKKGKKRTARKILYSTLNLIEYKVKKSPILIIEQAVRNASPFVQLKPRRIGGVTHQIPVFLTKLQAIKLAIRWLVKSTQKQTGKNVSYKLATEILEASKGLGSVIKKKEETHKMAEANKTFLQLI
jgi:small subunit ribosomal protein S7